MHNIERNINNKIIDFINTHIFMISLNAFNWLQFCIRAGTQNNLEIDFTKIIYLLDNKWKEMFCNFIDRVYSLLLFIAVVSSFERKIMQKMWGKMSQIFKPKRLISLFKLTFNFLCSTVLTYQLIDITNKYLEFSHEVKLEINDHYFSIDLPSIN